MRFTGNGNLYNYGDIIRLPKKARVLVVSDIHGNYDDFKKYIELWKKSGRDTHIVFLGDLIHGLNPETDNSIEILYEVSKLMQDNTFHVLMGNHEWYQIYDYPIYKNGIDQTEEFKEACEKRSSLTLDLCKDIMKDFKKIAIAPNGLVMTHTGPHRNMNIILKDMNGLTLSPIYIQSDINGAFEQMVFARPGVPSGYSEKDIERFLKAVNGTAMIVGHTPVGGYKVFGNQVIMDSSFATEEKYYLSMLTDEKCENVSDVVKNLMKME